MILEALWFKTSGRLYKPVNIANTYYYKVLTNTISRNGNCISKIRTYNNKTRKQK